MCLDRAFVFVCSISSIPRNIVRLDFLATFCQSIRAKIDLCVHWSTHRHWYFVAYWIDFDLIQGPEIRPYLSRISVAMQSCFAIFLTCPKTLLSNTQPWYYARGRHQEVGAVLDRLYAEPLEDKTVQQMCGEIAASLEGANHFPTSNRWRAFRDDAELQFGRRPRTSSLVSWA